MKRALMRMAARYPTPLQRACAVRRSSHRTDAMHLLFAPRVILPPCPRSLAPASPQLRPDRSRS